MIWRPRVYIISPFTGGEIELRRNIAYAQMCCEHSIKLGEAPFAGHLLYPQVLNDLKPSDRELGITLGWRFLQACDKAAVYIDRGVSKGMKRDITMACYQPHVEVVFRALDPSATEEYLDKVKRSLCQSESLLAPQAKKSQVGMSSRLSKRESLPSSKRVEKTRWP